MVSPIRSFLLAVVCIAAIASCAGQQHEAVVMNSATLEWNPDSLAVPAARFAELAPLGDVFLMAFDEAQLKMDGYHVTNAIEDPFYYGSIRFPAGKHLVTVYSIQPGKTRNVDAERDSQMFGPGGKPRAYNTPIGHSTSGNVTEKGQQGSRILTFAFVFEAGHKYEIREGKTEAEWRVLDRTAEKDVAVEFVPYFEEE